MQAEKEIQMRNRIIAIQAVKDQDVETSSKDMAKIKDFEIKLQVVSQVWLNSNH